jgi:hypothetical protein
MFNNPFIDQDVRLATSSFESDRDQSAGSCTISCHDLKTHCFLTLFLFAFSVDQQLSLTNNDPCNALDVLVAN